MKSTEKKSTQRLTPASFNAMGKKLSNLVKELSDWIMRHDSDDSPLEQTPETELLRAALFELRLYFNATLNLEVTVAEFYSQYAQAGALAFLWQSLKGRGNPEEQKIYLLKVVVNFPSLPYEIRVLLFALGLNLEDFYLCFREPLDQLAAEFRDKVGAYGSYAGEDSHDSEIMGMLYGAFLKHYNPEMRKEKGYFTTPRPLVDFIVRSVDYILKTKLDRPLGLADETLKILDPAAGTGIFLERVLHQAAKTITGLRGEEAKAPFLRRYLLNSLYSFETQFIPYFLSYLCRLDIVLAGS